MSRAKPVPNNAAGLRRSESFCAAGFFVCRRKIFRNL